MKRVLILVKGLNRGGTEQLLLNSVPYLDRSRFEYQIGYLVPSNAAMLGALRGHGVPAFQLTNMPGTGWVHAVRKFVRTEEIDLVHVHSPYLAIGTRLALPLHRRPPIVYTEHNVWPSYHRATYVGNMVTFRRNDHVFAVSNHVQASMRYPRPFGQRRLPPIETLHHGIDHRAVASWVDPDGVRLELGIPKGARVIGCVASFTPKKAHHVLLHAMAKVLASASDVWLVLVGAGPLEAPTRDLAAALGLSDRVIFTGIRDDAQRIVSAFDVFVLSSLHEGLSVAVVEALALGKPAVVTDAGGLPEVVSNGVDGYVVPVNDPDAMSDAIGRLLDDPELRLAMAGAARSHARGFDMRVAVEREESVYEELLS